MGKKDAIVDENKEQMAPMEDDRLSISIEDILDKTDPERLVQLIRKKRGMRKTQRLFSDLANDNTKRKSFPFEIQLKKSPKTGNDANDVVGPLNENSTNAENLNSSSLPRAAFNGNVNESRKSNNRQLHPRVSLKRLSNNLGRRVLLQTFEKLQKEKGFRPSVASTPIHGIPSNDPYESAISGIYKSSPDGTIPNITPITGKEQDSSTKAPSIKQPKTITHSHISIGQHNAPVEHTQVYDESIEVDHSVREPSLRNAMSRKSHGKRTRNEMNLVEETFINRPQDLHPANCSHRQGECENPHAECTSHRQADSTNRSQLSKSPTKRPSLITTPNKPPQANAEQQSAPLQKSVAEFFSIMIDRVNQSHSKSILAPQTPGRTDNSPCRTQGESFTVAPTQSPHVQASCPKSPLVVIPIYSQPSCNNQRQSKTPTTVPSPTIPRDIQAGRRNTSPTLVENVNAPEKPHPTGSAEKMLDLKNRQTSSKQSHLRKSINTTVDLHPKDHQTHPSRENSTIRRSDPTRLQGLTSFNVTSDEDLTEESAQNKNSLENNEPSRSQRRLSNVIDLRIPSRRSDYRKLSLKPHPSGQSENVQNNKTNNSLRTSHASKGNHSTHSESPDITLSDILKLEKYLQHLEESSSQQNNVARGKSVERGEAGRSLLQQNNTSLTIDEKMIDPLCREDAINGGIVRDISPRLGKLWMSSMIKNGALRKTMAAMKRGRRVISQNIVPGLSQPVTYDEIESSMRRQRTRIQARTGSSSNRRHRRKLYSKGISDIEHSSDEEIPQVEYTTHIDDTTLIARKSVYDKESKILKCRVRPIPAKIRLIFDMKEDWLAAEKNVRPNERRSQEKEYVVAMDDEDEFLFKIPQPVPIKRKFSSTNLANVKQKNMQHTILEPIRENLHVHKSHHDRGHSVSHEGTYEGRSSKSLMNIKNNQSHKLDNSIAQNTIVRITRHSGPSTKANESRIHKSQTEETLQYDSKEKTPRNSSRSHGTEERRIISEAADQANCSRISGIREISITPIRPGTTNKSEDDEPVEPDPAHSKRSVSKLSENVSHSANAHNNSNRIASILVEEEHVENTSENQDSIADSNAPGPQLRSRNESKKASNNAENTMSTEPVESTLPVEGAPKKTPVQNKTLSNKKTKKQDDKPNKRPHNNQIHKSIVSEASSEISGVRRSSRKRHVPRPYWTSEHARDELHICYVESPRVSRKKRTKKNKKRTKALETVSENKEPMQIAENLFDAIKEMSINKASCTEKTQVPAASSSKSKRTRKQRNPEQETPVSKIPADNEHNVNNIEQQFSTDSGHLSDFTDQQQTKNNFLLASLKNFVEPKLIQTNPELVKIFHMAQITIAPSTSLLCNSLDGVDYAYYDMGTDDSENYGYMRFHPNGIKKRARTKIYQLRLLLLLGVLNICIESQQKTLRHGDFVTVPKGVRYSLINPTDAIALLFFIKS